MSQSLCSRTVAALSKWQRRGTPGLDLIEAIEDPRERRRKIMYLTPKGRQRMTRALESTMMDRAPATRGRASLTTVLTLAPERRSSVPSCRRDARLVPPGNPAQRGCAPALGSATIRVTLLRSLAPTPLPLRSAALTAWHAPIVGAAASSQPGPGPDGFWRATCGLQSRLRQHRLHLRGIVLDAINDLPRHGRRLRDRSGWRPGLLERLSAALGRGSC
jgi:DNA-binding MarR family transcriptional regulator